VKKAKRLRLAEEGAARERQIKDNLADLALNAENEQTKVSASVAWLNRELGLPAVTNKNLNAATSYEELVRQSLKPKPTNGD